MPPSEVEPGLRAVVERLALALDLATGRTRLELIYESGRLVKWYSHGEARPASDLDDYAWSPRGEGDLLP